MKFKNLQYRRYQLVPLVWLPFNLSSQSFAVIQELSRQIQYQYTFESDFLRHLSSARVLTFGSSMIQLH